MQDLLNYRPTKTTWLIRTTNYNSLANSILSTQSSNSVNEYKIFLTEKNKVKTEVFENMKKLYANFQEDNLAIMGEIPIHYPSKMNLAKDLQYICDGELLRKYSSHYGQYNVLSLAGARPFQISKLIRQQEGTFTTFIRNKEDYQNVDRYVQGRFRSNQKINFDVKKGDILKGLYKSKKQYDYIDLDLCCRLDSKLTSKLITSLKNALTDNTILSITHTHRGSTYNRIYKEEIPNLIQNLNNIGSIKEHYHNYYYNSIQTYRETFVLSKGYEMS